MGRDRLYFRPRVVLTVFASAAVLCSGWLHDGGCYASGGHLLPYHLPHHHLAEATLHYMIKSYLHILVGFRIAWLEPRRFLSLPGFAFAFLITRVVLIGVATSGPGWPISLVMDTLPTPILSRPAFAFLITRVVLIGVATSWPG